MKFARLVLIVLAAALATACASKQAKTETPEKAAPPAKAAPAPAKESAKEPAKKEAPQGVVIGKPAAGSKFSKLKIGMTLSQVEKTIGHPTKQWTHPTAKVSIPFYFGPLGYSVFVQGRRCVDTQFGWGAITDANRSQQG